MTGKQSSFEIWENIILTGNTEELKNILNEDVIFYSPVVFKPQKGKVLVMKYLLTAIKIFKNKQFKYTNIIKSKNSSYAEFEAIFDNILVNGVDFIKTKDNLITEFKVFLRPLKGIEIVWEEMRKNLEINK